MNKIIFVLGVLLLMIPSAVAACTLSSNVLGMDISGSFENQNAFEFRVSYNQVIADQNIIFTDYNCAEKDIMLVVNSVLNLKMINLRSLNISGIDILDLNSNSSIVVNVDNKDHNGISVLDINVPKLISSGSNVQISLVEEDRSAASHNCSIIADGLKLMADNIEVLQDSNLVISLISDDVADKGSGDYTDPGVNGGPAVFDVNSVFVDGSFILSVDGGNGGKGTSGSRGDSRTGGAGGFGGDANFSVNYFTNNGTSEVNLFAGNGHSGGKGSDESKIEGACLGDPKPGGNGGNGGNILFDVNNFINQGTLLVSKLVSGAGGTGGEKGRDKCFDDDFGGSNGGSSGNINILAFSKLINSGNFDFNASAGDAGNSGPSDPNDGSLGGCHGGNGGSISVIDVTEIDNNSQNFKILLKSGKYGIKDSLCGSSSNKGSNGITGSIGDININYLTNSAKGIEITKELNQSVSSPSQATDAKTGNVNINNLISGSYLPKSIMIIPNNRASYSAINISACYLKTSGVDSLEYQTNLLKLYSANKNHVLYDFNLNNINNLIALSVECPHCEAIELNNPFWRVGNDYSIYSTQSGTIKANDLNIYYALDSNSEQIYNLPSPVGSPPVYTNKADIIGEDDSLTDGLKTIYKYTIEKDNLKWWKDPSYVLTPTDKPYCYGQQYYIKGKIMGSQTKSFEFPFLPLYKVD